MSKKSKRKKKTREEIQLEFEVALLGAAYEARDRGWSVPSDDELLNPEREIEDETKKSSNKGS